MGGWQGAVLALVFACVDATVTTHEFACDFANGTVCANDELLSDDMPNIEYTDSNHLDENPQQVNGSFSFEGSRVTEQDRFNNAAEQRYEWYTIVYSDANMGALDYSFTETARDINISFLLSVPDYDMIYQANGDGTADDVYFGSALDTDGGFAVHFGPECTEITQSMAQNFHQYDCSTQGWTVELHDCFNWEVHHEDESDCSYSAGISVATGAVDANNPYSGRLPTNQSRSTSMFPHDGKYYPVTITVKDRIMFDFNNGQIVLYENLPTNYYKLRRPTSEAEYLSFVSATTGGVSSSWYLRFIGSNEGLRMAPPSHWTSEQNATREKASSPIYESSGEPPAVLYNVGDGIQKKAVYHRMTNLSVSFNRDDVAPAASIIAMPSEFEEVNGTNGSYYYARQHESMYKFSVQLPSDEFLGTSFFLFTERNWTTINASYGGNLSYPALSLSNGGTISWNDHCTHSHTDWYEYELPASAGYEYTVELTVRTNAFAAKTTYDGAPCINQEGHYQGEHHLLIQAVDKFGNVESPGHSVPFALDYTAPCITAGFVYPNSTNAVPGQKRFSPNATFTFSIDDVAWDLDIEWMHIPNDPYAICHLSCLPSLATETGVGVNGGHSIQYYDAGDNALPLEQLARCESPFTTPTLPDGTCTLTVLAEDSARNVGRPSASKWWTSDSAKDDYAYVVEHTWEVEIPPWATISLTAQDAVCLFGTVHPSYPSCLYSTTILGKPDYWGVPSFTTIPSAGTSPNLTVSFNFSELVIHPLSQGLPPTDFFSVVDQDGTNMTDIARHISTGTRQDEMGLERDLLTADLTLTNLPDGTYTMTLPPGAVTDDANQTNFASNTFVHTVDTTPPDFPGATLVMTSSNPVSSMHARVGDTITLTAIGTEQVSGLSVEVMGVNVTSLVVRAGNHYSLQLVVTADYTEGTIPFKLFGYIDHVGLAGANRTAADASATVVFDNTPPTITDVLVYSSNLYPQHVSTGDQATVLVTTSEVADPTSPPNITLTKQYSPWTTGPGLTTGLANVSVSLSQFDNTTWVGTYTFVPSDHLTGGDIIHVNVSGGYRDLSRNVGAETGVWPDYNAATSYTIVNAHYQLDSVTSAEFGDAYRQAFISAVLLVAFNTSAANHAARVHVYETVDVAAAANAGVAALEIDFFVHAQDSTQALAAIAALRDTAALLGHLAQIAAAAPTPSAAHLLWTSAPLTPSSMALRHDGASPSLEAHTAECLTCTVAGQAAVGDTIRIQLTTSEACHAPTITMLGHRLQTHAHPDTAIIGGSTFEVVYNISTGDTRGAIYVDIDPPLDLAGNVGSACTSYNAIFCGASTVNWNTGIEFDSTAPTAYLRVTDQATGATVTSGAELYSNAQVIQLEWWVSEEVADKVRFDTRIDLYADYTSNCDTSGANAWDSVNSQPTTAGYQYVLVCTAMDGGWTNFTIPKPGGLPITDRAGNTLVGTQSFTIRSDLVAPVTSVSVVPALSSDNPRAGYDAYARVGHDYATITLTFTDPAPSAGLVDQLCRIEHTAGSDSHVAPWSGASQWSAWTTCPGTISLTGLEDGRYTVQAKATDAAGNQGLLTARTWEVDAYECDAELYCTSWKSECADATGHTWDNSTLAWDDCEACNAANGNLFRANCWDVYLDCSQYSQCASGTPASDTSCVDAQWRYAYSRAGTGCPDGNMAATYNCLREEVEAAYADLPVAGGSRCAVPSFSATRSASASASASASQSPSASATASTSVTPSNTASPSRTPSISRSASVSPVKYYRVTVEFRYSNDAGLDANGLAALAAQVAADQGLPASAVVATAGTRVVASTARKGAWKKNATTTTTVSVILITFTDLTASETAAVVGGLDTVAELQAAVDETAGVTATVVAITAPPASICTQLCDPPRDFTYEVSTNLAVRQAATGGFSLQNVSDSTFNPTFSFQGDMLRYSDIDAVLHCECNGVVTRTCVPGCDWVVKSAVRILVPQGYTAFSTWRIINGDGNLDKSVLAKVEMEWQSALCTWGSTDPPTVCNISDLPLTEYVTDKAVLMTGREAYQTGDGDMPLLVCWEDVTRVPHCMAPQRGLAMEVYTPFPLVTGQDLSIRDLWERAMGGWLVLIIFVCVLVIMIGMACCGGENTKFLCFPRDKQVMVLDVHNLHTNMIVKRKIMHTQQEINAMNKEELRLCAKTRVRQMPPGDIPRGWDPKDIERMETMHLKKSLSRHGEMGHATTLDRNRIQFKHGIFIFVLITWRVARMFMLTITFAVICFNVVTNKHFETWKQHDEFRGNLTTQLSDLSRTIEDYYVVEKERMQTNYNAQRAECLRTSGNMEAEYSALETDTFSYHSGQMGQLDACTAANSNIDSAVLTTLSDTRACTTDTTASFRSNFINCTTNQTAIDTGTGNEVSCLPYSAYTPAEWLAVLSAECDRNRPYVNATTNLTVVPVSLCVGYGVNTLQEQYFIVQSWGRPQLDESSSGYCYGYVEPSVDIYALYRQQVNASLSMANNILGSIRDGEDPVHVTMDYGAEEYGFQRVSRAAYFNPRVGDGRWSVYSEYGCPNCPTWFSDPTWPTANEASAFNWSNSTYNLSSARGNVSASVDVSLFQQLGQQYYNESYFPDLVVYPTMDLDVWTVLIPPQLALFALGVDVLLIIYRTIIIVGILGRYLRGIDKTIPLTMLGYEEDWSEWAKKRVLYCCAGIFVWLAKRLKKADRVIWMIIGKLMFLFNLVMIGALILCAYWFVDNLISVEVFEKTKLFSSLTAGNNAHRVIRNEQLASIAYAHNTLLETETAIGVRTKAYELSTRQESFNTQEVNRITDYNGRECPKLRQALEDPFLLSACAVGSDFPGLDTSGGACPPVSGIGNLSAGGSIEFELDTSECLSSGTILQNFFIDEIQLDWRWDPPTLHPEDDSTEWVETRERRYTCGGAGSPTLEFLPTSTSSQKHFFTTDIQCGIDFNGNPEDCPTDYLELVTEASRSLAVTGGGVGLGVADACLSPNLVPSTPLNQIVDASKAAQLNAAEPRLEPLMVTIELLNGNFTSGQFAVSWSANRTVAASTGSCARADSTVISGYAACDQDQCRAGNEQPFCHDPPYNGDPCDASVGNGAVYSGTNLCSIESITRETVLNDASLTTFGADGVTPLAATAKRIRLTVEGGSREAHKYYRLEGISVTGHENTEDYVCPEAQWRKVEYEPTAATLGNCSTIMPIHGRMMRVFDTDQWTEDIKQGYIPFIQAVRALFLAPFYIALVALIVLVVIELFLVLVEVILVKANLVRQNTYAKVPCTQASKAQAADILRTAKTTSHDSVRYSEPTPGSKPFLQVHAPGKPGGSAMISSATVGEMDGLEMANLKDLPSKEVTGISNDNASKFEVDGGAAQPPSAPLLGSGRRRDRKRASLRGKSRTSSGQSGGPRVGAAAGKPHGGDWVRYWDQDHGREFFFNVATQQTLWEDPLDDGEDSSDDDGDDNAATDDEDLARPSAVPAPPGKDGPRAAREEVPRRKSFGEERQESMMEKKKKTLALRKASLQRAGTDASEYGTATVQPLDTSIESADPPLNTSVDSDYGTGGGTVPAAEVTEDPDSAPAPYTSVVGEEKRQTMTASAMAASPDWEMYQSADGRNYFYNKATKESVWAK